MCLVQCQSAEQYSFWAWNILTKNSHLARWNYDKVLRLHHYYCCSGFRFVGLFRLTFVTLLKSNSLLVPDPAVLVVCAGKCKTGRKQGGNSVRSGLCGSAKGYGTGLKCLRAALQSVCFAACWGRCQKPRALAFGFLVWQVQAAVQLGLVGTNAWWWLCRASLLVWHSRKDRMVQEGLT